MAEMKKKEDMFRILKLTHDSADATYMVQRKTSGFSAFLDILFRGSRWWNVVEVCTLIEAQRIVATKYYTYKQEFSGRVVGEEQVWP